MLLNYYLNLISKMLNNLKVTLTNLVVFQNNVRCYSIQILNSLMRMQIKCTEKLERTKKYIFCNYIIPHL